MCCENMDSKLQQMDSNENVNPMDPSCSPSLDEDGCTVLEGECSEDGDSEDDYDSIQKPAFLVEGVPNFDLGPPEDGWEYLRRVRYYSDCQQLIAGSIMHSFSDYFSINFLSLYSSNTDSKTF